MLSMIDIGVVATYAVVLLLLALYVSRDREEDGVHTKKTARDYFLAGNSLPWWAVGCIIDRREHLRRTNNWHVGIGLCHRAGDRVL